MFVEHDTFLYVVLSLGTLLSCLWRRWRSSPQLSLWLRRASEPHTLIICEALTDELLKQGGGQNRRTDLLETKEPKQVRHKNPLKHFRKQEVCALWLSQFISYSVSLWCCSLRGGGYIYHNMKVKWFSCSSCCLTGVIYPNTDVLETQYSTPTIEVRVYGSTNICISLSNKTKTKAKRN